MPQDRSTPPKPSKLKKTLGHLRPSDLRGIVNLATQATQGVATMAEGVHQSVWGTLGAPGGKEAGRARGLTGFVYRTVHGVTEMVGKSLEAAFTRMEPLLGSLVDAPPETPLREAVLAALNGVMGDRLAATHNPLATPMTLRHAGQIIDWHASDRIPCATGKALILIHGLCMNDLQWRTQLKNPDGTEGPVVDHGEALSAALHVTPIHVRYNTGLHTSQNGRLLADQLETLTLHWPVALQEITGVVHSMGGLILRSALHDAQQRGLRWPALLKNIVFLGTPHHGSPLERAGNWVDVVLGSTPYSKPLAKLGQLRSAGITDLRFGHVLEADWHGHDRFHRKPDSRTPLPLPEGVACYTVAATAAGKSSPLSERIVGDGLVPLPSALGRHADPSLCLDFPKAHQHIAYRTHHMALLSSPAVTAQIVQWLKPAGTGTVPQSRRSKK